MQPVNSKIRISLYEYVQISGYQQVINSKNRISLYEHAQRSGCKPLLHQLTMTQLRNSVRFSTATN